MWSVYKLARKLTHLGHVTASDEKKAFSRAIEEPRIPEADRDRLVIRPFSQARWIAWI